jgi:hypothetical protein
MPPILAFNLHPNSKRKKKDSAPSPPNRNSNFAPEKKKIKRLSIYLHLVRRISRTKKLPGESPRSNQKENNNAIHDDGKTRRTLWPTT